MRESDQNRPGAAGARRSSAGPGPGERLANAWNRLSPWPGGRWLFSRLIGRMVPYSGSISATVLELRPGFARIRLRDHRAVRNHLDSIHAVALLNLAELTSGLAMLVGAPRGIRSIVTGISMEYTKKARGRLTCESRADFPAIDSAMEHVVHATIRDEEGDEVARASVRWRLSPPTP